MIAPAAQARAAAAEATDAPARVPRAAAPTFAELARVDPHALAARLEAAVGARLGAPLRIAIAPTGPVALARALAAAGRATTGDRGVAHWPCPYASLTHAGEVAIAVALPLGVTAAGVGVDLELDRPVKRELARLVCAPRERAWIDELPEPMRAAEVLRLWTAKEALYKADPAQGDAIVADYALEVPSAAVSAGGRAGDAPATVVSIRLAGATVSVALRPATAPPDPHEVPHD